MHWNESVPAGRAFHAYREHRDFERFKVEINEIMQASRWINRTNVRELWDQTMESPDVDVFDLRMSRIYDKADYYGVWIDPT